MKILVFADSHLFTKDDPEFLKWVKYWSKRVDKVIICGDLWDSYFCTFEEFVNSHWKEELFPILKSKNSIYIFGNHDREQINGYLADVFSDKQADFLDMKIGEKVFHFEHGDRFFSSCGTNWRFLGRLGNFLQLHLSRIFGTGFFKIFREQAKNLEEIWEGESTFLVCGHIHYPYLGSNSCVLGPSNFGYMSGLIIEDGELIQIRGYEEIKRRK